VRPDKAGEYQLAGWSRVTEPRTQRRAAKRFLRSSQERSKRATQRAVTVRWVARLLRSRLRARLCNATPACELKGRHNVCSQVPQPRCRRALCEPGTGLWSWQKHATQPPLNPVPPLLPFFPSSLLPFAPRAVRFLLYIRPQLVMISATKLAAVQPRLGELLWRQSS